MSGDQARGSGVRGVALARRRWWLTAAVALLAACGGADPDGGQEASDADGAGDGAAESFVEGAQAVASGPHALPGRIEAEDYGTGGEGVGYHDTTAGNKGGVYRTDNVDIQAKDSGGYNVGWIEAGEWLSYDVTATSTATYTVRLRVASGAAGTKKLHLEVDGKSAGGVSFSDASGWQSWIDVTLAGVSIPGGSHKLRLVADTGGFNLNYFELKLSSSSPAPDPSLGTLWVGANNNKPDTSLGSFLKASDSAGPWRVRRSFSPNLPSSIKNTPASGDAASNVITFHSVKPPTLADKTRDVQGVIDGKYNATIASLAASFPTDHTTYLTMYHEPEDDLDGATFVKMFRRFYQVAKKANPHLWIGTVHMSYYWQPSTPLDRTDNPDAWWAGDDYTDFIGVDDYNIATYGTTKEPRTSAADDPSFQRWFNWAKTKGKPLAVVEFGRLEDPDQPDARAKELLVSEDFLRKNGFFMFLYWNGIGAKVGNQIPDWSLTPGASQDAMRAISGRGHTGW